MTPEISILKHLFVYENWNSCHDKLTITDFPKELMGIFSALDSFHSSNPGNILTSADLTNLVFSVPVKDREYTQALLEQVDQCEAKESTTLQLINALQRQRLLKEISLKSYEVSEGRETQEKLNSLLEEYTNGTELLSTEQIVDGDFLNNNLEEVVNKVVKTPGLRWRLNTMNQMLGSLRKGNFGFVFARPETGKTTFLASEVTYMAEQLTEEQGPIMWWNNEQVHEEVLIRLYQAALGLELAPLLSNISAAQEEYIKVTQDKLKLVSLNKWSKQQVEHYCKKYKPSLLLFDQLDKIEGFKNDREDLRLGEIYIWARDIAKEYCPVIAVCQADGTGEGQMWLTMANVANAKTSKQAEADWILGIGKKNDPGYENIRYLHLSKNKLLGDSEVTIPALRHGRRETLIDATTARFKDL